MEMEEASGHPRGGERPPLDHRQIRRNNGKRILDAVRRHGPISRAALATRTELSAPTVCALVDDLVGRRGLLRNVGKGASNGGRPPLMVDFNADFGYVVGIDIGSRIMRFVLGDLRGRVAYRCEQRTPTASREAILEAILGGVDRLFVEGGFAPGKLFAIGVGAPGMTDVVQGRVIRAVNLKDWVDVPLRDTLQDVFKVPAMVDNDVNMAALGERWAGCAASQSTFVFVALGAGVGAGIIIDGRLHRGSRWYAGEISHMHLDYRRWKVDYGEQGFLESVAGADAIARHGLRLRRRGAPPVLSGDHAAAVFEAARAGDPRAQAVVQQIAVYLGTAVANIAAVLDPALIVFGGGISHVGEQLLQPVREVVSSIVPNVPEIRVSAAGDDAQVFGALYSALQLADVRLFELL